MEKRQAEQAETIAQMQQQLAGSAEKDARVQQLEQALQQEQQARQQLQRDTELLREVNHQLTERVAKLSGRERAPRQQPPGPQQQQGPRQPQQQQQQQQGPGRDKRARTVVVVGAEAADKDTLLAGVTAAAGLDSEAVENAVRSGPVWLVFLRTEEAARQVLEAKAAIAQATKPQQGQDAGEQQLQQEAAPQQPQQQQQQQQQQQEGWRVRPDRSLAERKARREHKDLLYRLYCEGARPRVHADGQVYVKIQEGQGTAIVPHTAWDPSKRLADSIVRQPEAPRNSSG
jgi:hypothetical protein